MNDPLRTLTAELADRQATTPGELRAARWLVDAARRHTHQVWLEPFASFRSPRLAWMVLLGLSLLGGMLLWHGPGLSLCLTLLAALGFAAQALGWLELGWLFPGGESQNVVGVVPARGEIRERLVVVAHYDTGDRIWSASGFAGVALAVMLLPPAAILAMLLPGAVWDGLALLPLLGVAAGLISLSGRLGMRGNAAGVAACLAVGRGPSLQHTEVWTLFTGSRIPGLVGMQAFLRRHGRLMEGAGFIVLEENEAGATLWQRQGEAAVIAGLGYRVLARLTASPDDIDAAVARVRAVAEEIDLAAGNLTPSPGPDCGTLRL